MTTHTAVFNFLKQSVDITQPVQQLKLSFSTTKKHTRAEAVIAHRVSRSEQAALYFPASAPRARHKMSAVPFTGAGLYFKHHVSFS